MKKYRVTAIHRSIKNKDIIPHDGIKHLAVQIMGSINEKVDLAEARLLAKTQLPTNFTIISIKRDFGTSDPDNR